MIGIIGYGFVGKAVAFGFKNAEQIICDPQHNTTTIEEVCEANPKAIFVCVPTPTDDNNYSTLTNVLDCIKRTTYDGIVVVKSTVLPQYLDGYDVLYNPEFLSRASANTDFTNPPMMIIGGDPEKADKLVEIYKHCSTVITDKVFLTDIKTASLTKYAMNSFYATKLTFMNQLYDVAQQEGVQWQDIELILKHHPWMGTHHFSVPGPDGKRGFGGPCLPKDTEALVKHYGLPLLHRVLELNTEYRAKDL